MVLEPGSQTQPLEQDRRSKKDAKMTPQTTNNREAAPTASGLWGRVLRTIIAKRRRRLRDSGGECFAPCEARSPKNSQGILRSPGADS